MVSNNILKANTKSKAYKQPIKQNNSGIIHDDETSCKVGVTYLSVFPNLSIKQLTDVVKHENTITISQSSTTTMWHSLTL